MEELVLYSNNTDFFGDFGRELTARLENSAPGLFRIHSLPLLQLTFYEEEEAPPSLCIVDIRDDPRRNMEFVRSLKQEKGAEIMVVASGPEWAMQAYNNDVLSYFLDPPDPIRAASLILRRFARSIGAQAPQFSFRTANGRRFLSAEQIVYVEYSNHRLLVHTDRGNTVTTTTMRVSFGEAAARLLEDPRFIRTHASFLVNITHVAQFGQYVLIMDNGASIPISHGKKPEVKKNLYRFFNGNKG